MKKIKTIQQKKHTALYWTLVLSALLLLGLFLVLNGFDSPADKVPYETGAARLAETEAPSEPESEPPLESEPTEAEPEPTETEPEPTETEPVETQSPEQKRIEALAKKTLARMTTEEKVAQLFLVTPEALVGINGYATVAGRSTQQAFDRYPVGGILYMEGNLETPKQTGSMLAAMQAISRERLELPIFLAVDEEGGTVARITGRAAFGTEAIPDMAEVTTVEQAEQFGKSIGTTLAELGFNLDLAPVADVLTNPEHTLLLRRSFGSDPEQVTALCAALSDGLTEAGVLPCYKHFPGHGGTAEDSHKGAAVSERTMEELWESELLPFLDAADRGVPFLMVGHVTLPNATEDALPASLSGELITGLLREEIGYDGIVITDALNMGAITQEHQIGEASVLALNAGADMLLLTGDFRAAYDAVLAAVEDGTVSEERLDESVLRILRVKLTELPTD